MALGYGYQQPRKLTTLNFFTQKRKKLMMGVILGGVLIGLGFIVFGKAATNCDANGLCKVSGYSTKSQGNAFVSDDFDIPLDDAETSGWDKKSDNLDIKVYAVQAPGTVKLHRLYQPALSQHFFTTDETELNSVMAVANAFGQGAGQVVENSGIFVYPSQAANTIPVYRVFNPTSHSYFYTTIKANADFLLASQGYNGAPGQVVTAFYAYPGSYSPPAAVPTAPVTPPATAEPSCLPLTASDWELSASQPQACILKAQASLKIAPTGVYDEATRIAWRAVVPYPVGASDDPANAVCPGADATDDKIASLPQPSLCIKFIQAAIKASDTTFTHALDGKWDAATKAGWRKLHPTQAATANTTTYGSGTMSPAATPSGTLATAVEKKVVNKPKPDAPVIPKAESKCPSLLDPIEKWQAANADCKTFVQSMLGMKDNGTTTLGTWDEPTTTAFTAAQAKNTHGPADNKKLNIDCWVKENISKPECKYAADIVAIQLLAAAKKNASATSLNTTTPYLTEDYYFFYDLSDSAYPYVECPLTIDTFADSHKIWSPSKDGCLKYIGIMLPLVGMVKSSVTFKQAVTLYPLYKQYNEIYDFGKISDSFCTTIDFYVKATRSLNAMEACK